MHLIHAEGPAPLAEAWHRYVSPSTWPDWAPQISRVSGVGDPVAPGDRGWVHGPALLRIPFEILEVDDSAMQWSWRVGIGMASVTLDHGVSPVPSGTQAWARVHLPTALVWSYTPLARLALRRLVSG